MNYKYVGLIIVVIILFFIEIRSYYHNLINKYLRMNNDSNSIVYDYLIKYIHCVSKNNYFMNYGLWDKTNNTLIKANKNLCNFLFKEGQLNNTDTFNILDVGCGYGKQDFLWQKMLSPKSTIVAVDISDTQIKFANKLKRKSKILKQSIKFMTGDAHHLTQKFKSTKFNRIMSLESAFHYPNRPLFFKNVSKLLSDDGLFLITDIIVNDKFKKGYFTNFFIKLACDLLCIPEKNLITLAEWKKSIKTSKMEIVKLYDITEQTFGPYYKFFFETYISEKNLSPLLADLLCYVTNSNQGFSYVVAVCKKKH
jgi:cyclopropane fatty-acyl-phospholipid synthase-like methyltransferase